MKKSGLIAAILCAGFVLVSCGQDADRSPIAPPTNEAIISSPVVSNEVKLSSEIASSKAEVEQNFDVVIGSSPVLGNPNPQSVRQFMDGTSNLDLMNYFATASATGLGITAYQGFESPAEISSNGLMDFFIYASNPDDYYNSNTKKYTIPVVAINRFLDNYFENVSFVPDEEVFFKDYYDAETEQFVMPVFMTKDVRGNPAIADRIDHGDGTVTIKADIFDIDDSLGLEGTPPIGQETLTIKIANGKTFFQRYLVEFY